MSEHPSAVAAPPADPPRRRQESGGIDAIAHWAAVALGSVLVVATAINQPYNENEWAQIYPYDSTDPSVITSGTRQPPLDPLLGALVQHLLGEGQLRQRLVPVICGCAVLVLVSLLLRRMRLGAVGALAMFVLATAPVFLRYSAYIRPYALPMFLMMLCCYAGTRWLDDGRRRWLALAVLGALLLPLARVPESLAFLGTSVAALAWIGWRRPDERRRIWTLAGGFVLAVLTVGGVSYLSLKSRTSKVFDTNPANAIDRAPDGFAEIVTYVLPLYADWFPWWPVTLVFLVLACTMRDARGVLGRVWWWIPLALAPVAFLLAYHLLNPFPFDIRHYRARFAYFYAPPLAVLVAAVGYALARSALARRFGPWVGVAAVALVVACQLPTTARVVTENDVPDFGMAGEQIKEHVPDDGVVLFDSPTSAYLWRQPFSGEDRYVGGKPDVVTVDRLANGKDHVQAEGPVWLLILDSECAPSVACDMAHHDWGYEVPGYRLVDRFDRFRLYEPVEGQAGVEGAKTALRAMTEAYGLPLASDNVWAEARLLKREGRRAEGYPLLEELCAQGRGDGRACLKAAADKGLYPPEDVPPK